MLNKIAYVNEKKILTFPHLSLSIRNEARFIYEESILTSYYFVYIRNTLVFIFLNFIFNNKNLKTRMKNIRKKI